MTKNIIFYSNNCDYSKEILQKIDNNSYNNFIKVCIDDEQIEIPSFIEVVPTIFLTEEKRIVINNEIIEWLNDNTELSTLSSNYSTMFSSLDNIDNNNLNYNNYSLLEENTSIYTPQEESDNSKKTSNEMMKRLKDYR